MVKQLTWMEFVKLYRSKYPNLKYSECLQKCSPLYAGMKAAKK